MNSQDTSSQIEFARRSRQLFQGCLAQLDDATRAKLRAARSRAIRAGTEREPLGLASPRRLAAGVLGAAVLAVWLMSPGPPNSGRGRFDVANSSDLELLLGGEDFDMVQNLEFYAWLEEQTDPKPAAKTAGADQTG